MLVSVWAHGSMPFFWLDPLDPERVTAGAQREVTLVGQAAARMRRAWEARLEHFNVILWVAGRNECFLSLGGLDYEKAQLESVCRVWWILNVPRMRSGDY